MDHPQFILRDRVSDVRFVTEDIERFWRAYDLAAHDPDPAAVYEREYLIPGSAGLSDFARHGSFDGQALARVLARAPAYFAAIRANTLAIAETSWLRSRVETAFQGFAKLYPPARFQDVYFLMGGMNSGGTASPNGLLIGAEMNARDSSTPVHELNPWLQQNTGTLENLPFMIAHEAVHSLQYQAGAGSDEGRTLLWRVLMEGGADFLVSLATGEKPPSPYYRYGLEHERELWRAFSGAMDGQDVGGWLYDGDRAKDHPADRGYFVGHRILEAFYNRATDKAKAIADLLAPHDERAILAASGYNP